ncbi:hypothetical protein [Salmonella enterica]|uniref:hypothetical protein n=1 Tax=Salmonella enterica TaxID=28901 RepID=UPI001592192D|nr:hypothetical protein [Salmonella enterica]
MLGGADNPNGELPSYITGANSIQETKKEGSGTPFVNMSEYDILVLFYLLSGRKSYAVGRYLQST